MLLRNGLLLSSLAVFLQIAVFLQPLLPKQYQIAPVCETISQVLIQTDFYNKHQHSTHHQHTSHESFVHAMQEKPANLGHDHHDPNHQCQYCTVYGNLVLPPELEVKQVLDRIQVRLLAFQQTFSHVWFVLQRLFLIPQGRAPPIFA
ncbi:MULTISPECIES: DUF2946 family protein [Acinetobacter]|uniref:DUF2946 domain-containing protein n=1 Tax=Acinetobacter piscicola TaxID=2006115 RepID=A0A4Q4GVA5_9GAMM|nr:MULTISPECIES: DUF2946 family protein [Acinetobacter]QOW44647.1 DUF2946 domain-containing protein [Acinetobacter piscicola]RYL24757.1 DUF2946 domain-containing protein [Acinetobacter piscicola]